MAESNNAIGRNLTVLYKYEKFLNVSTKFWKYVSYNILIYYHK